MCGRFALFSSKKKILDDLFIKKENINNFSANYNISPSHKSPILLNHKDQPIIKNMAWGLIPKWSYDIKVGSKLDILLERIERLGQMGDVVIVKDGFARNFLLP